MKTDAVTERRKLAERAITFSDADRYTIAVFETPAGFLLVEGGAALPIAEAPTLRELLRVFMLSEECRGEDHVDTVLSMLEQLGLFGRAA